MKIIITLMGKAGAGKDTLLNKICDEHPEYHKIISCTTRPMRENEKNGQDYHFLSHEDFIQKVLNGDMLEATEFNGWHYGTTKSSLIDGINIGVFNPEGYDCLTQFPINDICIIGFYIKCNDKERLLRQLNREQNPNVKEIIRRYNTDEADFFELDRGNLPLVYCLNNDTKNQFNHLISLIPELVYEETTNTKLGQNY